MVLVWFPDPSYVPSLDRVNFTLSDEGSLTFTLPFLMKGLGTKLIIIASWCNSARTANDDSTYDEFIYSFKELLPGFYPHGGKFPLKQLKFPLISLHHTLDSASVISRLSRCMGKNTQSSTKCMAEVFTIANYVEGHTPNISCGTLHCTIIKILLSQTFF